MLWARTSKVGRSKKLSMAPNFTPCPFSPSCTLFTLSHPEQVSSIWPGEKEWKSEGVTHRDETVKVNMIKVTELENVTYVTDISNGYYPCKKFVTTKNMQVCQQKEGKYLQNFLCINLHNFYICYPKLFFLLVVFNSCAKIVSIWFQGFGQCQCKRIYILQLWTVKVMWSCVPVPGCPWKVVGLTSESEKWEWKWKWKVRMKVKSENESKHEKWKWYEVVSQCQSDLERLVGWQVGTKQVQPPQENPFYHKCKLSKNLCGVKWPPCSIL